jgi:hypothetical protein
MGLFADQKIFRRWSSDYRCGVRIAMTFLFQIATPGAPARQRRLGYVAIGVMWPTAPAALKRAVEMWTAARSTNREGPHHPPLWREVESHRNFKEPRCPDSQLF